MIKKYRVYTRCSVEVITILGEDKENVYLFPDGKPESNERYFDSIKDAKRFMVSEQEDYVSMIKKSLKDRIKIEKLRIKREDLALERLKDNNLDSIRL